MSKQQYDLTYDDLNPTFLFTCNLRRKETETNYHCHEFIEVSIITEGSGTYYIDGAEYPLNTGDLIILNPGTYHRSIVSDTQSPATEFYIAFSDIHIRSLEKNTLPLFDEGRILSMGTTMKQEVFKLCTSISKEFQTGKPGRYFMLKAYLIQLILLILREQKDIPQSQRGYIFESTNKKYIVKQIIQYFDLHYREKISLDQIAQNMYLSTFYISKVFKSETGDTPINYLIELRMEKAREYMLENPACSIQDVSSEVGYEDVYHFSKLFKKHFGTAPSKYRRAVD